MDVKVPFNQPTLVGTELDFVRDAATRPKLGGDGHYGRLCEAWFEEKLGAAATFLTPSCTAALEMAALVAGISPGDEVIMPSFTFVSSANAFALRGANIVFVDIRPDTMNVDETRLEAAITRKTRAILVVHYGGVACDMEPICEIATRHGVMLIEDAAHSIAASYRGRPLGSFGAISTFSFHETKNITSGGEGGLIAINDPNLVTRARIVREKGTNRAAFEAGMVPKYSWVDLGGSYVLNEISAAWLWAQLQALKVIQNRRQILHDNYCSALGSLTAHGCLELQYVPSDCAHNSHIFYLRLAHTGKRDELISHLRSRGVAAHFHYVPLHSSDAGRLLGRFDGKDVHTTNGASRLLRLPLFFNMSEQQQSEVIHQVREFFQEPRTIVDR